MAFPWCINCLIKYANALILCLLIETACQSNVSLHASCFFHYNSNYFGIVKPPSGCLHL